MKIFSVKTLKVLLVVLWFLAIIFTYYLYQYPQALAETRKMQGVVTSITPSEIIINTTRTHFLPHPDRPEMRSHSFELSRDTIFKFDAYVYRDDTIVATRGTPIIDRKEVYPGDAVFIHFNTVTGVAEEVLVATPILWY